MAKWYGAVGFATTVETRPGYYEEEIIEGKYYGDLLSNFRNLHNSGKVNDDVDIANKISMIADPFANNNFHTIRYAEFMGTNWKVTNVEVQYPRLILTLGGVYHGDTGEPSI